MNVAKKLRTAIGYGAFGTGLHQWILRDKAVITVFHRICSGIPENYLSCPPSLFRRYCDFFNRHFEVVGLQDMLDRLLTGRRITRCLAITFDDGYRDNFSEARPILEEYGLPATFFPTVGFIESERDAPWDKERGIKSEWMTWDEVRALVDSGFSIGGHTLNHVDLGATAGEDAVEQICRAKIELEERVGQLVDLFSYPFGGPDRISEENRQLVKKAGFSCCLSAHGGLVTRDSDPFRLPRVAITDWHTSPEEWGFDLLRSSVGDLVFHRGGTRWNPRTQPAGRVC